MKAQFVIYRADRHILPLLSLAALIVLVLTPLVASAQQRQYVNVLVDHQGEDRIGQQFAYELREQLRASSRYDLSTSDEEALLALHVVSVDASKATKQEGSGIALTLTLAPSNETEPYIGTWVVYVAQGGGKEMAASLLASVDKDITELIRQKRKR